MSLNSWMEEFYPESADMFSSSKDKPTIQDINLALIHTERKWAGLTTNHLLRHNLAYNGCVIYETERPGALRIDSASCALCVLFVEKRKCGSCPLVIGGNKCTNRGSEKRCSDYAAFTSNRNPMPMLNRIQRVMISRGITPAFSTNTNGMLNNINAFPPQAIELYFIFVLT